jgi:hypothetical protein
VQTNRELDVKEGFNAAIDHFQRRWTMRILWKLRDAQLLEHTSGEGYQRSLFGRELLVTVRPLAIWSNQWSKAIC